MSPSQKNITNGHLRQPITAPQIVKTFDAGIVDSNGYGEFTGFVPTTTGVEDFGLPEKVPFERRKRVIIVGAGVCGIQQASILLRDGSIKPNELQMFDAMDDFGGVWQKNKYPGCACDVPAMIYTTSYNINRNWTHFYARREQIQDYYAKFAESYNLRGCIHFNSLVRTCKWDDDLMVWHVMVEDKVSGKLQHWISDVICQNVGSLDRPKWGNTPGREKFQGVSWHTAHWRPDYDMRDKNVAFIGCGPSAAQIIPEVVDKMKTCTVYMRTPPICVPRMILLTQSPCCLVQKVSNQADYYRWFTWAVRWVPLFAWTFRMQMNIKMMLYGKKTATDNTPENDRMTRTAVEFMESQISDPVLRERVRPNSKYYCKRPLRLDNFYTSLAKPNCTVLREDLVRYTEQGVISRDKKTAEETERKFDVIIFGTGFNVAQFLEHEKITGVGGRDLQQKWKEHPEALYGLATSGFPNMFMCFGPNSATVWSSQQDNWEQQARFASKAVREIVSRERRGVKFALSPDRDVERKYNLDVQLKQNGSLVWARPDCVTYYKNDAGWNTYTMPWTWWEFRRMLSKIRWNEWVTMEKSLRETEIGGGY